MLFLLLPSYSLRTLKHLIQYSTLIPPSLRTRLLQSTVTPDSLRQQIRASTSNILSELPLYLSGAKALKVPLYTVWGACEDVSVLEKFRSGEYTIPNLNIIDESATAVIDIGGVKLRLFGLGGAIAQHKLFDIGDGKEEFFYIFVLQTIVTFTGFLIPLTFFFPPFFFGFR